MLVALKMCLRIWFWCEPKADSCQLMKWLLTLPYFRAVGTFWKLVFQSHFSLLLHTCPGQASSSLCVPQPSVPTKYISAPQGLHSGSVAQARSFKLLFSFWSAGTPVFLKNDILYRFSRYEYLKWIKVGWLFRLILNGNPDPSLLKAGTPA